MLRGSVNSKKTDTPTSKTQADSTNRPSLSWRGTLIIVVGVVVALGGIIFLLLLNRQPADKKTTEQTQPDHQTITPKGTSINTYGGWHRVSPDTSEPVYAYDDILKEVVISVSQQPLPDSFKKDPDASVAEFAKQNSYSQKIKAGDVTAYIGTNAKGPQSVVFTKDNLLIFIKSQDKISDKAWIRYISALE